MAASKKRAKKAPSKRLKYKVAYVTSASGPVQGKDGAIIAKEIQRLACERGGMVTSKELEKEARNPNSLLHKYFEWDTAKAALKYRIIQAQRILNCIRYEVVSGKLIVDVPAFTRIVNNGVLPDAHAGYGYVSTPTAAKEINFERQVIDRALQDVRNFTERYKRYKTIFTTLKPIFMAMRQAEEALCQIQLKKSGKNSEKTPK